MVSFVALNPKVLIQLSKDHVNEKNLIILAAIFILSRNSDNGGYKYNYGELPYNPVNLEDFNSEYDDYNSTAPTLGELLAFCFSTNRNSKGNDFDVIYQPMNRVTTMTNVPVFLTILWSLLPTDPEVMMVLICTIQDLRTANGPRL